MVWKVMVRGDPVDREKERGDSSALFTRSMRIFTRSLGTRAGIRGDHPVPGFLKLEQGAGSG